MHVRAMGCGARVCSSRSRSRCASFKHACAWVHGRGPAGYRIYPVRAGEELKDIIVKRKITVEEMQGLNPGVDLQKLKGGCCCTCMHHALRADREGSGGG